VVWVVVVGVVVVGVVVVGVVVVGVVVVEVVVEVDSVVEALVEVPLQLRHSASAGSMHSAATGLNSWPLGHCIILENPITHCINLVQSEGYGIIFVPNPGHIGITSQGGNGDEVVVGVVVVKIDVDVDGVVDVDIVVVDGVVDVDIVVDVDAGGAVGFSEEEVV
jgi:hypothetical protein